MKTMKAEIQIHEMESKKCRDCKIGSRFQERNSLPNVSNHRAYLQCIASTGTPDFQYTWQAFHHKSEPPRPRIRHASAPSRIESSLLAPTRHHSNWPHDRMRSNPRTTRSTEGGHRKRCLPTLRIITGRGDKFCNDGSEEMISIAHSSSQSHVYHIGGTQVADVVRATPSTSLGGHSAGFLWDKSPGQRVEALDGDQTLPGFFSTHSADNQEGCIRDLRQLIPSLSHNHCSLSTSVDRTTSTNLAAMTVSKTPRNVKASRRQLFIGLNERKRQSLLQYDGDESHDPTDQPHPGSKPASPISSKPSSPVSLRHPQFRTLRRKKHFDVARCRSSQDGPAPEPIAISLTLRSPTAPKPPAPSIHRPSNVHLRKQSDPDSIATASDYTTPPSPHFSDILSPPQNSPTYSTATSPTASSTPGCSPLTTLAPSCSPSSVKFGHPSRPYYTAIRKQGVSPPSSRPPTSSGFTSDHPSSPSSRPKSSPPPPLSAPVSSHVAARHLSLSAMPRHQGFVSAFSLDLHDSDDEEDDPFPLPPTPAPIPARFSFGQSLASAAKRLSRKSCSNVRGRTSSPPPSALLSHRHGQSHSISYSPMEFAGSSTALTGGGSPTGSGFSMNSPATRCGFSMSGETELRLALAKADAELETGANDDGECSHGFSPMSYPTTPSASRPSSPPLAESRHPPLPSFIPSSPMANLETPSQNSFAVRVKKLRNTLKHMLHMNTC